MSEKVLSRWHKAGNRPIPPE